MRKTVSNNMILTPTLHSWHANRVKHLCCDHMPTPSLGPESEHSHQCVRASLSLTQATPHAARPPVHAFSQPYSAPSSLRHLPGTSQTHLRPSTPGEGSSFMWHAALNLPAHGTGTETLFHFPGRSSAACGDRTGWRDRGYRMWVVVDEASGLTDRLH
ncbi:hypothetical protein BKA80DRAFT_386 [Phyllosticta citrichinensis]